MVTAFRNSTWRQPPSWTVILVLNSDSTDAFYIEFATTPPSLVRIGQMVKKWQQFFEIHDGGSHHLEFWWMCVFDMTIVFYNEFARIVSNLVRIGPIVKKWQQFFLNSRRRQPSSWILINIRFWHDNCVLCPIRNVPTKFDQDWFTSKEMVAVIRKLRWRRQPSWKIHFRLNRQYENGTPGL